LSTTPWENSCLFPFILLISIPLSGEQPSTELKSWTRSKGKPSAQDSDAGAESFEARIKDISTKKYELEAIRNVVKEKKRRIQAHEKLVQYVVFSRIE